jgi:nucleoid-associated protein YgaU
VVAGDTLSKIAKAYLGDADHYVETFKAKPTL